MDPAFGIPEMETASGSDTSVKSTVVEGKGSSETSVERSAVARNSGSEVEPVAGKASEPEVKPAGTTVIHSDIEFTIERGHEEESRNPDTPQLDLF